MKKINLKKYLTKKIIISALIVTTILLALILMIIKKIDLKYEDTVKYEGKTYYLLEYNQDVFTYNFYYNGYLEEELVQPIKHDTWDIVYLNGDLFLPKKEIKKAIEYYGDDKNYDWFITTEENDVEVIVPISLTEEEKEFIYDLDNKERKETFTFDDIEQFADITKVSKDKTIFALVSLAKHDGKWYWKTEVMTDDDREYIIKLPESLNNKINESLK